MQVEIPGTVPDLETSNQGAICEKNRGGDVLKKKKNHKKIHELHHCICREKKKS